MPKLQFILDKQTDALNRYYSVNGKRNYYWTDFSKNIPTPILEKILNKTEDEALQVLNPMLDKRYEANNVAQIVLELNQRWAENGEEIFAHMEKIVWKQIPVTTLSGKITTTWKCPYNRRNWYFLYSPFKQGAIKSAADSVWIAVHELLHMMLHHYYEEYIKSHGLSDIEFHDMKEAQTVILNEEYWEQLWSPDTWYPNHIDIREKFEKFRKENKNFNEFVDYGIQVMLDRRDAVKSQ